MDIVPISSKINIEYGGKIIKENPFYFTLHLILKYYFTNKSEYYLLNFLKDVTNSENEFKVFMIYIEFCIEVYNTKIKNLNIQYENDDEFIYFVIGYIKKLYDNDHSILKPFIKNITENELEVIKKFNIAKLTYNFKKDAIDRFNKLNNAVDLLNKATELENKAKEYKTMAMEILTGLKGEYGKDEKILFQVN